MIQSGGYGSGSGVAMDAGHALISPIVPQSTQTTGVVAARRRAHVVLIISFIIAVIGLGLSIAAFKRVSYYIRLH
jgi:hypothetical protein